MISVIRLLVPCSMPLVSDMTGTHGRTNGAASSSTDRNECDGTPMTTTSACDTASSRSAVARRSSWSR